MAMCILYLYQSSFYLSINDIFPHMLMETSFDFLLDLSLSKFSLSRAYDNCSRPVDFKLPLL